MVFVEQFEGRQLRGPNQICFDADGELFFTDSGAFGETSLAAPRGAVYRTVHNRQQVVQVIPPTLAHPTGIAYDAALNVVYVAEMHTNRVLRLSQRPKGVYHATVFYQLAGSVGPSSLAVHGATHDLYVAKMEYSSVSDHGTIDVVKSSGELKGTIVVPAPEISGICFDAAGKNLYIAEQSKKAIFRVSV